MILCLQARNYVASMPKWPKKDFREVFLGANPNGEEGIMGTISKKII